MTLAVVRKYASLGWKVFPVHSIRNGRCSCGKNDCADPGKHPRVLRWQKEATDNKETLQSWWFKWPDANIGIATGKVSGVWVLDVDVRPNEEKRGDSALFALCDGRELPNTPLAVTGAGQGSHHIYFAWSESGPRRNSAREDGLDVRSDGGFVIAPPSSHLSGGVYDWDVAPWDVEPAPAPEWLTEALVSPVQVDTGWQPESGSVPLPAGLALPPVIQDYQPPGPELINIGPGPLAPERLAEIQRALSAVPPDGSGPILSYHRGAYEGWVAIGMGLHDETNGSDQGYQLFDAWSASGTKYTGPSETLKKWRSFSGSPSGRSISTLFELAWKNPAYAAMENGSASSSIQFNLAPPPALEPSDWFFGPDELLQLPPPDPIVDGMMATKEVALIYGPPGSGKSFAAISMCVAVARGEIWFDRQVRGGPVVYSVLEGKGGMQSRLVAACGGIPQTRELVGRFLMTEKIRLDRMTVQAFVAAIRSAVAEGVLEDIPKVVVIDTLAQSVASLGIEENSAKDMSAVMADAEYITSELGCCTVLVHHAAKSGGMRGSSAIDGAADRVIRVEQKREEEPGEQVASGFLGNVLLSCEKSKDDEMFETIRLQLCRVELPELEEDSMGRVRTSCRLVKHEADAATWSRLRMMLGGGKLAERAEAILSYLKPFTEKYPARQSQMIQELGFTRREVQGAVQRLEKTGHLERASSGNSTLLWMVENPDVEA